MGVSVFKSRSFKEPFCRLSRYSLCEISLPKKGRDTAGKGSQSFALDNEEERRMGDKVIRQLGT